MGVGVSRNNSSALGFFMDAYKKWLCPDEDAGEDSRSALTDLEVYARFFPQYLCLQEVVELKVELKDAQDKYHECLSEYKKLKQELVNQGCEEEKIGELSKKEHDAMESAKKNRDEIKKKLARKKATVSKLRGIRGDQKSGLLTAVSRDLPEEEDYKGLREELERYQKPGSAKKPNEDCAKLREAGDMRCQLIKWAERRCKESYRAAIHPPDQFADEETQIDNVFSWYGPPSFCFEKGFLDGFIECLKGSFPESFEGDAGDEKGFENDLMILSLTYTELCRRIRIEQFNGESVDENWGNCRLREASVDGLIYKTTLLDLSFLAEKLCFFSALVGPAPLYEFEQQATGGYPILFGVPLAMPGLASYPVLSRVRLTGYRDGICSYFFIPDAESSRSERSDSGKEEELRIGRDTKHWTPLAKWYLQLKQRSVSREHAIVSKKGENDWILTVLKENVGAGSKASKSTSKRTVLVIPAPTDIKVEVPGSMSATISPPIMAHAGDKIPIRHGDILVFVPKTLVEDEEERIEQIQSWFFQEGKADDKTVKEAIKGLLATCSDPESLAYRFELVLEP